MIFLLAGLVLIVILYALWELHGLRPPTDYEPRRYKQTYLDKEDG